MTHTPESLPAASSSSPGRVEVNYETPAGDLCRIKFKHGVDQLVPTIPNEDEWFRAPFLQSDIFWDQKMSFPVDEGSRDFLYALESEPENEVQISPSSIPRFNIERGEYPYSFCHFFNYVAPFEGMEPWTDWILSQSTFKRILRKASIFEAIRGSAELRITRNTQAMEVLLSRWSTETHTFITAFGEITPTLEDVTVLMALPTWGEENIILHTETSEERGIMDALLSAHSCHNNLGSYFDRNGKRKAERGASHSKSTFKGWMHYWWKDYANPREGTGECVDGPGLHSPYHLAAYIAAWLSRHIFEGPPADGVRSYVFRIAATLSLGKRISLGPLFLGTLFYRLDLINMGMRRSVGRYDIPTYISTPFLQMWLFERFKKFAPKPNYFSAQEDENGNLQPYVVLRSDRWSAAGVGKKLSPVIDNVEEFCWRPYAEPLIGEMPMPWYFEDDVLIDSLSQDPVNPFVALWAVWIMPRSLPALTDDGYTSVGYYPHRVARQFGCNQYLTTYAEVLSPSDSLIQFLEENRDLLLSSLHRRTLPKANQEGSWAFMAGNWWHHQLQLFEEYVYSTPMEIKVPYILKDDHLLSPAKAGHSRGATISRFSKALGIIPGVATTGMPSGARLIPAAEMVITLPEAIRRATEESTSARFSKKRPKKAINRSSPSKKKTIRAQRARTINIEDNETSQDTPDLELQDVETMSTNPEPSAIEASEKRPTAAVGISMSMSFHTSCVSPSVISPARRPTFVSSIREPQVDSESDHDSSLMRVNRLRRRVLLTRAESEEDSAGFFLRNDSPSIDATSVEIGNTIHPSPEIAASDSPLTVTTGSSPVVTNVLLNSSMLSHGEKELPINHAMEGCRDSISVPNASINVSIPAAVPTFTPTIVATMPESSNVNVNTGSEISLILPSKEELFDGVAPFFLPFLHRLYHYRGNIFSKMTTQPCFLRIMNLQILGSLMQSLDKKPLESLTLEEIDGLCSGLNAVKSCHIDICWLETGLQDARHLVEASHVKAELTQLQQEIDTTERLLSEMKNKRAKLMGRAETLMKLSTTTWTSDSSIFENLLK